MFHVNLPGCIHPNPNWEMIQFDYEIFVQMGVGSTTNYIDEFGSYFLFFCWVGKRSGLPLSRPGTFYGL